MYPFPGIAPDLEAQSEVVLLVDEEMSVHPLPSESSTQALS